MAKILAIESSCDETAASVIENGHLLSNIVSTQIDVHRKYGGVMPEIASRLHTENISIVIKEAMEEAKVSFEELDAVAVTRGPGLIGALHVGLQAAKTIAMLYNIPLIPVHHLAGHIYANEYVSEFKFPLLSVVVSGGNTELVLMKDHLNFEVIAETRDDAIGECYDKVARVLGLPYPGGVPIDKLSNRAGFRRFCTTYRLSAYFLVNRIDDIGRTVLGFKRYQICLSHLIVIRRTIRITGCQCQHLLRRRCIGS